MGFVTRFPIHAKMSPPGFTGGGVLLAAWFLLDGQTLPAVRSKRGAIHFPYEFPDHAQASETVPEEAVAYRRAYVDGLLSSNGFALEALRYGRWSGAEATVGSFQDLTARGVLGSGPWHYDRKSKAICSLRAPVLSSRIKRLSLCAVRWTGLQA